MTEQPVKILVVDDNPASRYATSRILLNAGFFVFEAATGVEGLALAESGVHLIVLDVNLPDIDGFAVCRKLRAQEHTCHIPVIHLSATFVADIHKVKGLESGADGYLTHPVEPPVLIATVNAFLRTRQAEEAMRASQAKFRAIFDQAINGIVLMTPELVFLEANAAMCQMLGRPREQIIGKHSSAFTHEGNGEPFAGIGPELANHQKWRGTFPLLHADGRLIDFDWSISIHSMPGVLLGIVSDVTDRRLFEVEREHLLGSERAARADAERANRLKDDFLATLSHELRTPLNAIVGWSQLLSSGALSSEEFQEGVAAIFRNAKLQAQLISDLLDVSRITSGKLRLDMQSVDLPSTIMGALDSVVPAANAKGVILQNRLEKDVMSVCGDPLRLTQVIVNLLNNAVKFTPKGGTVCVKLQRVHSSVEIVVTDTGQGISSEFLPHIFERFRQEDGSTRRDQSGLGLGLAIVKSLIDSHGGTVSATSAGDNKGSEFTVRLPVPELLGVTSGLEVAGSPQADCEQSTQDRAMVSLQDVKVMVVDDDPDARVLAKRILKEVGASVFDASSVDEALGALDDFKPQVLISDIGMPQADGYDLIRQVRSRDVQTQLPAIALTAFARVEDRHKALRAGFQLHMVKPVDPRELIAAIASLVVKNDREGSLARTG
jgi:PAS domain S-box-containing protein